MMCKPDEAGARLYQRGKFRHSHDCPHKNDQKAPAILLPECPIFPKDHGTQHGLGYDHLYAPLRGKPKCRNDSDIYVHTIYKGCVLTTRERNGYHDSDFYAVVWDEQEQRIRSIEYATTRAWTYPNSASIDATAEVRAKATTWLVAWAIKQWDDENKIQARMVESGKRVRVVKGRKVPLGTEGWVGWIEDSRYGKRVACIDTIDGERLHYVAISNLEVVNPEGYLKDQEERERFARTVRHSRAWHVPFVAPGFISI